MRARPLQNRSQRGAAVTEFAIMAPVLVSLVLYATFFHDAIKMKLKTQEAANFAVWEMTSLPMSQYSSGGGANHSALMTQAKSKITTDLTTLYQNLDSADPNHTYANTFVGKHKLLTGSSDIVWTDEDVPLASSDTLQNIGLGSLGGQLSGFANRGMDFALSSFDFDTKGLVTVQVSSQFDNAILPTNFLDRHFGNNPLTPLSTIVFHEKAALVVDDWAVNDGSDVDLHHAGTNIYGSRGGSGTPHPMAKQVSRMAFLGLDNFVPGLQDFAGYMGNLLPDPLGIPVASLNYYKGQQPQARSQLYGPNCALSSRAVHGCEEFMKGKPGAEDRDVDIGMHKFNTAPLRTTFRYADSMNNQVFEESGPWYMGCTDAEQPDPTKCHHP